MNCETFRVQPIESMFSFLLDLMFSNASLWLRKSHMRFKPFPWLSINAWNLVACIGCTSPHHNSTNIVSCLPTTCIKSTNKCCMSMLFSLTLKTSFKTILQIFFSKSCVLWGVGLVYGVYCGEGMGIGQGFSMVLNTPFHIPLNES
jgi:hypothetical protein